jgi:flagellar hook-associated protein 1 FlgK
MSISNIIHTGTSGLIAAQSRIAVTSTNITNADTVGYTTKTAYQGTTVVGGVGTGVAIVGVGNTIDKALMSEVMNATSAANYDAVIYSYLNSVLDSLGNTSEGSDMEEAMTELMDALSEAITAGGDATSMDDVINALEDWTNSLDDASAAVQAAREDADQAIAETVTAINDILEELDDLNEQIVKNLAMGTSTADLEDAQRVLLEELSSYVDITYFTTSTGETHVYTSSGTALLTSTAKELSYTPYGSMGADSTYDGSGTGIQGITIDGVDVTSQMKGGTLGGLIDVRDEELPAIQEALDELAITVADALNEVANGYSASPAPNSLTSDGAVTATDTFTGSGTITVLTVDEDGVVTGSTDIDLDALSGGTYQDVIDALDGVAGVSASLDADGNLVISADNADEGVILTGDGTAGADGDGFSHHFGFNNVLSGTGADDMAVTATLSGPGHRRHGGPAGPVGGSRRAHGIRRGGYPRRLGEIRRGPDRQPDRRGGRPDGKRLGQGRCLVEPARHRQDQLRQHLWRQRRRRDRQARRLRTVLLHGLAGHRHRPGHVRHPAGHDALTLSSGSLEPCASPRPP